MIDRFLPVDSRGDSYSRPAFWIKPKEYAKIRSEINQIHEVQYKNKRIAVHIPLRRRVMEEFTIRLNNITDSYYGFV